MNSACLRRMYRNQSKYTGCLNTFTDYRPKKRKCKSSVLITTCHRSTDMQDFVSAGLRWNPTMFIYSHLYCAVGDYKYSFFRGREADHVCYVYRATDNNNICCAVIVDFIYETERCKALNGTGMRYCSYVSFATDIVRIF
jgi:hypothetical protein